VVGLTGGGTTPSGEAAGTVLIVHEALEGRLLRNGGWGSGSMTCDARWRANNTLKAKVKRRLLMAVSF